MKILILLSCLFCLTVSYKILVYTNLFGHSHVKLLGSVTDALTDAGHNVTVLMPIIDSGERSRTGLKTTKNVIFVEPAEKVLENLGTMKEFLDNLWIKDFGNPIFKFLQAGSMAELFSAQCDKVLASSELLEKLRSENFDLALTEPFDSCAYALFEAINIRAHVSVLSCGRLDHVSNALGQPSAASYVPGAQATYGEKMTLYQKFMNVLQLIGGSYMFTKIGDVEYEKARKIVGINRSWREVLPETTFLFTNQIPLLDFPAPTLAKIIPIGGISVKIGNKHNVLEEKWRKILALRKTNVLISFGSNAKSVNMPDEFKQSLLEVFKQMPNTTFIWKYEDESDQLASHLDNVYLGKWLPQNELLADSRLSLFLTHGGLGSVTELAMLGKPSLMVPLFADQSRNAEMLKRHGGALVLQKTDLKNPTLIRTTIEQILSNKEYRLNAEKLAEILNNQPTNPKETLIKHVEFAARFGKMPTMDSYGRQLSFIQYYLLDLIFVSLLVSVISIFIFFKFVKFIFNFCSSSNQKIKSQ